VAHPTDFDPYFEWLGISPADRPLDHYRLLGLPHFESDLARIERHADERMAKVRRSQTGPRGVWSQHILNELSSARGCLTHRETKLTYDAALHGILSASQPVPESADVLIPPPAPSWEIDPIASAPVTPALVVIRDLNNDLDSPARSPTPAAGKWIPVVVALVVVAAGLILFAVLLGRKSDPRDRNSSGADVSSRPRVGSDVTKERRTKAPENDSDPNLVRPLANGKLDFPVTLAQLHGESLAVEVQHGRSVVAGWKSTQEYLEWTFRVEKPGVFRVRVHYTATEPMHGGRMMVSVGESRKGCDVRSSEENEFHYEEFYLAVRRSGENRLTVRAESVPGPEFLVLERIEFLPR